MISDDETVIPTAQFDDLLLTLDEPDDAPNLRHHVTRERRFRRDPCPCPCSRGEFCGGCGHAGCAGRR